MREWQVGDPIGDGNDIGVPDIPYMSYLKDDESSKEDIVEEFKFHINSARDFYNLKNYETAFFSLESAFNDYNRMNDFEKSQVKDNPFNQDWIPELCCTIINNHGEYFHKAIEFILKNNYSFKLCMDCNCAYPATYKCCIKCGKPLTKPKGKPPEEIVKEIPDILRKRIWDEDVITRLVNRSLVLMKSNDSRLVEIRQQLRN